MRTPLIALILVGATAVFGQSAYQVPSPPAQVRVDTEVEELALGYAAALHEIHQTPVYLVLRQNGSVVTLVSVKSLVALHGVLLVELDSGLKYAINPKDVITLTDAPPAKR